MLRDRIAAKIMRRRRYCPWCPVAKYLASWAARVMNAKAAEARRAKQRFAEAMLWATANAIIGTPGFATTNELPALPKTRKARQFLREAVRQRQIREGRDESFSATYIRAKVERSLAQVPLPPVQTFGPTPVHALGAYMRPSYATA